MKESRLTWIPPGTTHPGAETESARRALFGLHLAASLMLLLAVWPPGWRLGDPTLTSPFSTWWAVEVTFLGLASLQFGAERWRGGRGGSPSPEGVRLLGDRLWLLLFMISVLPIGLAAYRVSPVPPGPPPVLAASLGAELLFFTSLGRVLRRSRMGEPSRGLVAWGLFLLLSAGVWLPGLRAWHPLPGLGPLPALGPVPYPLLFDQPAVLLGSRALPPALLTAVCWAVIALGLRAAGGSPEPDAGRVEP